MKKKYLFALPLFLITLCSCSFFGKADSKVQTFGDFSHNGVFLTEYAVRKIDVDEAKDLIDISPYLPKRQSRVNSYRDNIKIVLSKYASLLATVKYYEEGKKEQQVREELYQGTDFKHLLETNHYEPFGQMSVKYLFVDDELLNVMEEENQEYLLSESHITSPFNEPYTYHEDKNKELVLQTHSFAELPASTCGGIGSTFREDCELLFDEEGKIKLWQSSLGIYTSTPEGTLKEGFIFEVDFEWVEKE